MGNKKLSFADYIERIPEEFRKNIFLLNKYKGNRSDIEYNFNCGCKKILKLKSFFHLYSFYPYYIEY
jgi:predicted CopG family antitoxin